MRVILLLCAFYPFGSCVELIYKTNSKPGLEKCVGNILQKYFEIDNILTYYNTELRDDDLLKAVHAAGAVSIQIGKVKYFNIAYLIVVNDDADLLQLLIKLSMRGSWRPDRNFLVVINSMKEKELIFDNLLKFHILHVIVVNGTDTAELYTYNPFDNYACGKYYVGITELGKCSDAESFDLYPLKLVTGLQNCTFNVSVAHWPPYALDPKKTDKPYIMGTEQYIFHLISQIEKFNYNFRFDYDAETFSSINANLSVSGPLTMIQRNESDILLGGLILTQARANTFFYISGHLDQLDDIRILVKRASTTPVWKNLYLEFSPLVWSLVLLALMLYAFFLLVLLKEKDKGRVVLIMFDNMLLHGGNIHVREAVSVVLICWIWFAFLINNYYQTSLVSLTMKPSLEYQVHNERDLNERGYSACISRVMQTFMKGEKQIVSLYHNDTVEEACLKHFNSLKVVSQVKDRYIISPFNIYRYYSPEFYDQYGVSQIYPFSEPFHKLIYAIYLYKGFPRGEHFHSIALRIRETGLSDKSLRDIFFSQAVKYNFQSRPVGMRFAIPWHVFIVGVLISCVTFLIEVFGVKH